MAKPVIVRLAIFCTTDTAIRIWLSQKLITELKTGKRVETAHDLQQLADELSMAVTVLEQLGKLGELNTQQSMIEILQRCQPYKRNRWRNKALE